MYRDLLFSDIVIEEDPKIMCLCVLKLSLSRVCKDIRTSEPRMDVCIRFSVSEFVPAGVQSGLPQWKR